MARKQELKRLYRGSFRKRHFDDGGSVYSSYAGTGPSYYNSYTAPAYTAPTSYQPPDATFPPPSSPPTPPLSDPSVTGHVPYGTQNPDGSYNVDAGPTGNYPGMPDVTGGPGPQIDPVTGQPTGPGPGEVPPSIQTDPQGNPIPPDQTQPTVPPDTSGGGGGGGGGSSMPSSVADLLSKLGINPASVGNIGNLLTSLLPLLQGNRNAQTPQLPSAPPGYGGAGSVMNIQPNTRQLNPAVSAMQPADWFTYGEKPASQRPNGGQFFGDNTGAQQPSPLQQAAPAPAYTPPQTNVNVQPADPNSMLAGLLKPHMASGGPVRMALGGPMMGAPGAAPQPQVQPGQITPPTMSGAMPYTPRPFQQSGPRPGSMTQLMNTGGVQMPSAQSSQQTGLQPWQLAGTPDPSKYHQIGGGATPARWIANGQQPAPLPTATPPIGPNSPGYSGNHFDIPGWQPGQPAPHNMTATQGMPTGWQRPGALTNPAFMRHQPPRMTFGQNNPATTIPRMASGGAVHYATGGYAPIDTPISPANSPNTIVGGKFNGIPGASLPAAPQVQTPAALAQLLNLIGQMQHRSSYSDRALAEGGQPGQPINPHDGFDGPLHAVGHIHGPGHGREDLIEAKLSDGEYVHPAHVVSALGNGSNNAGADILDKLGESVRKHVGKQMVQGKQPKNLPPLTKLLKGVK